MLDLLCGLLCLADIATAPFFVCLGLQDGMPAKKK